MDFVEMADFLACFLAGNKLSDIYLAHVSHNRPWFAGRHSCTEVLSFNCINNENS